MGRYKGIKNGQTILAEATCERCQKTYVVRTGDRGRYCSNECRQNRITKRCSQCGNDFSVRASKANRYNYCSIECSRNSRPNALLSCQNCGKEFSVKYAKKDKAKFCSRECFKDASIKQRVTFICEHCGKSKTVRPKFTKNGRGHFCSNRCSTIFRMEHGYETKYIAIKRQNGYRTDIEAMTEKVLIDLGIEYIFEHKIGRFSVDFSIPNWRVALECDGWQHLQDKEVARDAKRTEYLRERGWDVIRVVDKDIRIDAALAIRTALHNYLNP